IMIVFILSVSGEISIFKRRVTLYTRLAAADGLKAGDEVRLAGKRVGKVDDVSFSATIPTSPDQKSVIVRMVLDESEVRDRIRTDSFAVLGQQGFLGDRVIDITPGTTKGDAVKPGSNIPSADQASLAQVFQGASDVLVQFNSVGKQLQELMDNVNKGQGTIGKFLHDDTVYVNLNRTILEAQDLVKKVNNGQGTLARVLNDPKLYENLKDTTDELKGMIADIKAGKGTLGKFVTDEELYNRANQTLAKMNDTVDKLDKISSDIESGQGTIGKLIKDDKLHNDISDTVTSLKDISARLDKGEGTAGMLLHDPRLYNNADQATSEVVKLLYDFRQNPKKYLSIKVSIF
ncbi:MAG TPA: MlaD family protein, partial [Blastocatellia bacterium]|nr:MlaD family protein [Blastocatellia bacterium]